MSLKEILMPQLGESVTEGTISKWLVSPGEHVNKYDSIAEVMTDKVTAEVPILFTGTIKELVASEGETISVGDVICTIETTSAIDDNKTAKKDDVTDEQTAEIAQRQTTLSNQARFSPAVLKLSQQHNINLKNVFGTGAGGRITRKDILKVIEQGKKQQTTETVQTLEAKQTEKSLQTTTEEIKFVAADGIKTTATDVEVPVTNLRKTIADNMVRSKQEIPHAWMMVEADVTELVSYRKKLKANFTETEGYQLTFFPFFIKAVAQALKQFPEINAMWAGEKIVQKRDVNISVAIATEDALFVPVIKNADEKSIKGLAKELTKLTSKVQNNKLSVNDIEGGTFTVNNTGSFGSVQSMGIINYPQAAILQVEKIIKRPVVINNMIAVRDIVNLCLSIDHRVIDGLIAGRFLQHIKTTLENISAETTPIY